MSETLFFEQTFPLDAKKIITPVRIEDIGSNRFFEGEALWDTGSERTVIAECVAKTLKLDTLPFGQVTTPIGEADVQIGAVLSVETMPNPVAVSTRSSERTEPTNASMHTIRRISSFILAFSSAFSLVSPRYSKQR